jgi:hypothetical protein
VRIFSGNQSVLWTWKARLALLPLTAAAVGIGVYAISTALAAPPKTHATATAQRSPGRVAHAAASPSPVEFASDFVGTANAYAEAHRDPARLVNPDCVKANTTRYMCSYAVARPHRPLECHLVQVTWTPNLASTFTVTLSGRVSRCQTLKAALHSLR